MTKPRDYCYSLMEGNCRRHPDDCWYSHDLPKEDSEEYAHAYERLKRYREKRNQHQEHSVESPRQVHRPPPTVEGEKNVQQYSEYCYHALQKNGKHDARKCPFEHRLPPEDSEDYRQAVERMNARFLAKTMCYLCKRNPYSMQAREYSKETEDFLKIVNVCEHCHYMFVVIRCAGATNGCMYYAMD